MKTADIEKLMEAGTHVAVGTGYSTNYLGQNYGVSRGEIVAVRQERETVTFNRGRANTRRDGVLVRLTADDGWRRLGEEPFVVMARDILGTWEQHEAQLRSNEQAKQARQAARDKATADFDAAIQRLEDLLGERLPRDTIGVRGWSVDIRRQELKATDAGPIEWLCDRIENLDTESTAR